jgi:hypothetical protein
MNPAQLAMQSQAETPQIHVERDVLRWRIGSDYHLETECGLYFVCDVWCGARYSAEAYGRERRGQGFAAALAVGLPSREEAVRVCEAHAVGHRVP